MDAKLDPAVKKYEEAWDAWDDIFKQYPALMEQNEAEELLEPIKRYKKLISDIDQPFPPPGFKLLSLLEQFEGTYLDIDNP